MVSVLKLSFNNNLFVVNAEDFFSIAYLRNSKVLSNLWVFPEDVENIQKLYEEGIKLEVRAIPSDRSQDVLGLLQKSKLI